MKKGFTLIELLAVIVILAIIALIATPIVINIINDSKDSATLRSAGFYLDAVENSIMKENMNSGGNFNPSKCTVQSAGILLCDNKEITVEVDGELPIGGEVTFEDGNIKDVTLTFGDKTVVKNNDGELAFAGPQPYREAENISIPDLLNDTLTPVVYNGQNWIVADVTKKWYSYENQEWANAVILSSSANKKVGDVVTVDGTNPDALAMFVWIPRYEYKIEGTYGTHTDGTAGTATLPGEIKVNFITESQEATSEYRIHPAFTFKDTVSGIWVGKFETSHTTLSASTTSNNLGCSTESCESADGLRILPNVASLRYNEVSNYFYAIRSMSRDKNPFGIDKTTTNTHMMKNSEWGAVAYLSQSKYGKYGNNNYESENKEVYINNSSGYYTGRSGGSYGGNTEVMYTYKDYSILDEYNTHGYYTYDGYLLSYDTDIKTSTRDLNKVASTTGNIYGIYDMSGGSYERVMGVFANTNGDVWTGASTSKNSGFSGKVGSGTDYEGVPFPTAEYYDAYMGAINVNISAEIACNGEICYGHALSETSGWYGDKIRSVSSRYPWFNCGGYYADVGDAGVFYSYDNYIGGDVAGISARVVMVSNN